MGRDDGSDRLSGLVAREPVAGNNHDLEWRSLRGALGDDDGLAVGAAQEAVHDVQLPGSPVVVRHVEMLEHGERQRLHHHLLGVEESIRFPGEVEAFHVPAIDDEHLDVVGVVDLTDQHDRVVSCEDHELDPVRRLRVLEQEVHAFLHGACPFSCAA